MSQLEELIETVGNAIAAANDAHTMTATAEQLCAEIAVGGMGIGFGNDPVLILAGQEQLQSVLGVLGNVVSELETANGFIAQAQAGHTG
jgi:hypothetical protein